MKAVGELYDLVLAPVEVKKDGVVRLLVAMASKPADWDPDDDVDAGKRHRWKFPETLPFDSDTWDEACDFVTRPKLATREVKAATKDNQQKTLELSDRLGKLLRTHKLVDFWVPGGSAFLVQWWNKQFNSNNIVKPKLVRDGHAMLEELADTLGDMSEELASMSAADKKVYSRGAPKLTL